MDVHGFSTTYTNNASWFKDFYLKNETGIEPKELCTRSILIPDNTYMGKVTSGTRTTNKGLFKIYEIWCSEEDLSKNVYTNDNSPF